MEQPERYEVNVTYDPLGGTYNAVITVIEVETQSLVDSYEFSANSEDHALYVASQEKSARNSTRGKL